jgi:hypothetical protein
MRPRPMPRSLVDPGLLWTEPRIAPPRCSSIITPAPPTPSRDKRHSHAARGAGAIE